MHKNTDDNRFEEYHTVCGGCLATDRNLMKLENCYLDIYYKLTVTRTWGRRKKQACNFKNPHMCWQCIGTLCKIQQFQNQALRAKMILDRSCVNNMFEQQCLSTFTSIVKTDYDFEIIYPDDVDEEQYVKLEDVDDIELNILFEDECDVKDEEVSVGENDENDVKLENDNLTMLPENLESNINTANAMQIVTDDDMKKPLEFKHSSIKSEKTDNLTSNTRNEGEISTKSTEGKRKLTFPYRTLYLNSDHEEHYKENEHYKQVKIDQKELMSLLEMERNSLVFKRSPFKCNGCVMSFTNNNIYIQHKKNFHPKKNKWACDICGRFFFQKSYLLKHVKGHYSRYDCLLCDHSYIKKRRLYDHLRRKHYNKRVVECRHCGVKFREIPEFRRHFKETHKIEPHKKFICDQCGQSFLKKYGIRKHMRQNHITFECKECNKVYKFRWLLVKHRYWRHVVNPSEKSYCVECDKQFSNEVKYKSHLQNSMWHTLRPNSYPCPDCDKIYSRIDAMRNHYKAVHSKQWKHVCITCSKHFVTKGHLTQHIKSIHDKREKPKNKICTYCGRGFSCNKILENHIRTHTGERPYKCEHCSAAFTQKYPLVVHMKSVHKLHITVATIK